jgi:hypothetical protein
MQTFQMSSVIYQYNMVNVFNVPYSSFSYNSYNSIFQ